MITSNRCFSISIIIPPLRTAMIRLNLLLAAAISIPLATSTHAEIESATDSLPGCGTVGSPVNPGAKCQEALEDLCVDRLGEKQPSSSASSSAVSSNGYDSGSSVIHDGDSTDSIKHTNHVKKQLLKQRVMFLINSQPLMHERQLAKKIVRYLQKNGISQYEMRPEYVEGAHV
jgi:hypothetical protein